MPKQILIITGSPRKGGNSDQLASAFAEGARAVGHAVSFFDSVKHAVKGCVACDACWTAGKPCVKTDGFDTLYPLLEQANTLVFCGPLYWYSFNAQLKAVMDRMHAYMVPQRRRKLGIVGCALLMCAQDNTLDAFDGAVATYRSIARYAGWQDKGMLLVPGVHLKGEIAGTDALARATALGRSM